MPFHRRTERGSSPYGNLHQIRSSVAIAIAQLAAGASRATGFAATSLPGLVANVVAPDALRERARGLKPVALVAGTNGKTTTSRLLARIVDQAFGTPVVNASGANMRQSVATTILLSPTPPSGKTVPGVFEVDELALPGLVADLAPDVVVMTNLLRDQLDRYGEIEVIVDRWRRMLGGALDRRATVVYCADDARLSMLAAEAGVRTVTFGVDWPSSCDPEPAGDPFRPRDPISCRRCGRPLEFDRWSIGHLGRFACPAGHVRWTAPDVAFTIRDVDGAGQVEVAAGAERRAFRFGLTGLSFAYDAAAAAAAGLALGVPLADGAASLTDATAAFGRSEEVDIGGRRLVLSLAKNPVSLGEASSLAGRLRPAAVVVALNDAHAVGRDVSWIWDADIDGLLAARTVILAGARAADLGLRVKYNAPTADGRPAARIVEKLEDALASGLAAVGPGETLLVVATYTALLAVRRRLVDVGVAAVLPQ